MQQRLDQAAEQRVAALRKSPGQIGWFVGLCGALGWLIDNPPAGMFPAGLAAGLLAYGIAWLGTQAGLRKPQPWREILGAHPWQVWPCRMEQAPGETGKRLLLLAPDGAVAAAFRGEVPDQVWRGMTDGRGIVWIAGDLRFDGFAALPGGDPCWYIQPVPTVSGGNGGLSEEIQQQLVRTAMTFAFDQWIN
ncbi:hypothetical protein [Kitasatospora sp. NPDC056181]|uniref:hypothetical protein n=1 Tax=Kitasatospora sp. NPDC056181 TaxID=3345737 RepID=UPI0035DAA72D